MGQTECKQCKMCLPGSESRGCGVTWPGQCTPCKPGTFQSTSSTDLCQACPSGTFQNGVGSSECKSCGTKHPECEQGNRWFCQFSMCDVDVLSVAVTCSGAIRQCKGPITSRHTSSWFGGAASVACVFPFRTDDGTIAYDCVKSPSGWGGGWCATEVDGNGAYVKWAHCM